MKLLLALLALAISPVRPAPGRLQGNPPAVAAPAARVPVLQRVVVLGASLSQGFGLEQEVGARIGLADVLEASLIAPHDPVRPKTSLFFFTDPLSAGQGEVAAARAMDPTLVVGLDFLFWFGYGAIAKEHDRLAWLDKGLALLETLPCPLLLGDLPDVREAARSSGGPGSSGPAREGLLAPEQVPEPPVLKSLNEHLRSWAKARGNVVVVPLSDLVARLHARAEIEIHGNRWSGEDLGAFIQKDRLHPTLDGTIALLLGALDALVLERKDVPPSAFSWDAKAIRKSVHDSKEKERARLEKGATGISPPGGARKESGSTGEKPGGGTN